MLAALLAGAVAALGVSACGSSNRASKTSSATGATAKPVALTTPTPPPKPKAINVTVDGATVTIRLSTLGFNYCRANPRTCAAVKSNQLKYLTQNQRNAVKAAQKKVYADDAAAAAAAANQQQTINQGTEPPPATDPQPDPQTTPQTTPQNPLHVRPRPGCGFRCQQGGGQGTDRG
jgi:hypothetical protein